MISVEEDAFKEECLLARKEFRDNHEAKMRKAIKEFVATANPRWAKNRRREYLQVRIDGLERKLFWLRFMYLLALEGDAIVWSRVLLDQVEELMQQIRSDRWRLTELDRPENKNGITDAMIENAKRYPIDKLIAFDSRGYAKCFAHEERTPSLHRYDRGNVAHCFSCGETWDGIGVLVERDGKTFAEAVRALQ